MLSCLLQLLLITWVNAIALWVWNWGALQMRRRTWFQMPRGRAPSLSPDRILCLHPPLLPRMWHALTRHTSPTHSAHVTLSLHTVTCSHTPLTRHLRDTHAHLMSSLPHTCIHPQPDKCTPSPFHPCPHAGTRNEERRGPLWAPRQSPTGVGKGIAEACFRKCRRPASKGTVASSTPEVLPKIQL